MERRKFISATAIFISLCGCVEDGGDTAEGNSSTPRSKETEQSRNTTTETEKPSSEGATPECGTSMCEGRKLVDASVASDFSGDVVLKPNCRNEEFSIQPGESVEIVRKEDGETCRTSLFVDGEKEFDEDIEGYERVSLTVSSNGEVNEEWVVR